MNRHEHDPVSARYRYVYDYIPIPPLSDDARATFYRCLGAGASRVNDIVTVSAKELGCDVIGVESMPRRRLPPPKPLDEGTLPDDYKAIFAHSLRVARAKAGLRQEDVAQAIGVTTGYIARVESGSENLTIDTMKRLAEVVKRDLPDMLRRDLGQLQDDTPTN